MSGLLSVRNYIRDFLRKYDEITTPIIHFIAAFIMFSKLNDLFGYSSLFDRGMVTFWLALICALVSSPVVMIVVGLVVLVNTFAASVELGILWALYLIILYCLYMRMFPKCSFILGLTPVLFMFHLEYALPFIIMMYAGIAGIIPAVMGVVTYNFALFTKEAHTLILASTEEDNFNAYSYILDAMAKNKEMLLIIIVFSIVVLISTIVYKLPVNYSWYIAIGVGGLLNVICFMVCSASLGVDISLGSVFLGTILGMIVALVVQFFKGIVDYSKKESVQFEDDDFYYYVTAIPKFDVDKPKPDGEARANRQPKPDGEARTNRQPKPDGEARTNRQPKPDGEARVNRQPRPDGETRVNRQPRPDGEAKVNRQPRPDGEAKVNRQPRPDGEARVNRQL
ncbi:MAG: hypothetical protein ACI4D8_00070 [Wujia sp.]